MARSYFARVIKTIVDETDILKVINYARQNNILRYEMLCEECNILMKQVAKANATDKYVFRCLSKNCRKYKCRVSLRTKSILSDFNIPLAKYIHFLYLFTEPMEQEAISRIIDASASMISRLISKLREQLIKYFEINKVMLGGPGIVVQIDESKFNYNCKSHRGRGQVEPIWVFGIVDTSYSPSRGIMKLVERRNKETLLPIILEHVRPGSIIHSDEWKAYADLNEYNFEHGTVCHTYNFINPVDGVHTQNIESYWNRRKLRIKSSRGVKKTAMNAILCEYMFRDLFRETLYESILLHLLNIF